MFDLVQSTPPLTSDTRLSKPCAAMCRHVPPVDTAIRSMRDKQHEPPCDRRGFVPDGFSSISARLYEASWLQQGFWDGGCGPKDPAGCFRQVDVDRREILGIGLGRSNFKEMGLRACGEPPQLFHGL